MSAMTVFTSTYRVDQEQDQPRMHIHPGEFLGLSNGIQQEVDNAWELVERPLTDRLAPTEEEFRDLLDQALQLCTRPRHEVR